MDKRCSKCGAVMVAATTTVEDGQNYNVCMVCGEVESVPKAKTPEQELAELKVKFDQLQKHLKRIAECNSCNDCSKQAWCIARPKPGEICAINCALCTRVRETEK